MIITRIYCGLGNQMFQYAVGRRLALERRVPLGLETTFYRTNTFRQYRLDHFRIAGRVLTDRELKVLEPPSGRWEKLARRVRRQQPYRSYFEHAFRFHPEVVDAPKNSYVAGYWQSEKYFDTVADTIRADFALVEPMTAPRAAIRDGMRGANAVSLHIRRGDYASEPEITAKHGLIPIPWYEDAVRFIKARVPDTVFYVFSDEPDWAEAHLKLSDPCVFVRPDRDGRDFEDLHLMAACRHHIIANSSFSWWGAWLDPRPDKIVIAPQKWFDGGPSDTEDIVPETWTRM